MLNRLIFQLLIGVGSPYLPRNVETPSVFTTILKILTRISSGSPCPQLSGTATSISGPSPSDDIWESGKRRIEGKSNGKSKGTLKAKVMVKAKEQQRQM
jgi:hypothetical protein